MDATQTAPPPPKREIAREPDRNRHAHAADEHVIPKDLHRPGSLMIVVMVVVFVALLVGLFIVGWLPHERATAQANADAKAQSQITDDPIVGVIHPRPEKASKDVLLPCDVHANQQTAIYARSTGFLKQWLVDIGGQVKKDQLLAVIDAPDLDAQLIEAKATAEQAKASVVKSQADLEETHADYQRYLSAQKESPGSVTQQDLDTKRDAYADAAAAVEVAKATVVQDAAAVERLSVLQDFERVTAPFDGTITARNYDVGALINATNFTTGTELFDLADTRTLRVNVNVPQNYATNVTIGQPAYIQVRNYPHREFKGVVARKTGALDLSTRTLLFQLDFPNPSGELDAGMYGTARIPVFTSDPVLVVPSGALIFNASGVQIALVKDGKIHFQKITVGRDLGTELEITDGLSADDLVVINPGERISEGLSVQVKEQSISTTQK